MSKIYNMKDKLQEGPYAGLILFDIYQAKTDDGYLLDLVEQGLLICDCHQVDTLKREHNLLLLDMSLLDDIEYYE